MDRTQLVEIVQWLFVLSGLSVLVLVILLGGLRRNILEAGPIRRIGLVPADLLIGLGLMIMGLMFAGMVAKYASWGEAENETAAHRETLCFAVRVLLIQILGQGPPLLYLVWRARSGRYGLWRIGLLPRKPLRDVRWGLLGFCVAVPMIMSIINVTVFIGKLFGQEAPQLAHEMLKVLVQSDSPLGSGLIVVSAVLVAPVLEESLFRGLIQSVMVETLGESRRWSVVITASFVFAVMHGVENWQVLPGLFVLGMVLGWLYERSGSLWPGIMVHMGFNTMNILLAMSMTPAAG